MRKMTIMRILDFITVVAGWLLMASVMIASTCLVALAVGMEFPILVSGLVISGLVGGCSFVVLLITSFIDS